MEFCAPLQCILTCIGLRKDFPKAVIVPYESWEQAANDALQGKVLAALYDEIGIRDWSAGHPEGSLYVQSKLLTHRKDQIAIAVNREDRHLLSWINLFLEKSMDDGFVKKLFNQFMENLYTP